MRRLFLVRSDGRLGACAGLLFAALMAVVPPVASHATAQPDRVDISARGTADAVHGRSVRFSAANSCDPGASTGPFIVEWGTHRFAKTTVTQSECKQHPSLGFGSPAGFNTQTGKATGTLEDGSSATIHWTFVDGDIGAGLDDTVAFTITDSFGHRLLEVDTQPPDELHGTPGGVFVHFMAEHEAALEIKKAGPPGVLPNQTFDFTIEVKNVGKGDAEKVTLTDTLPADGEFVASNPAGKPVGRRLILDLGALKAGASTVVTVTWKAPDKKVTLTNAAFAAVEGGSTTPTVEAKVPVGLETTNEKLGVRAAGTALRNRAGGKLTVKTGTGFGSRGVIELPKGAEVTRAVLVWTVLINNNLPQGADKIKFAGQDVTPISSQKSGRLCWPDRGNPPKMDTDTIGFVADVTKLVNADGIGNYTVGGYPGQVTADADARPPSFPATDGASLFLFFKAPKTNAQVLSNFVYDSNVGKEVKRSFAGIKSTGQPARLWIAAADGQDSKATDRTSLAGSSSRNLDNIWNGADPITPPNLMNGNLWDTLSLDTQLLLARNQDKFDVTLRQYDGVTLTDCVGFAGVVLAVVQ